MPDSLKFTESPFYLMFVLFIVMPLAGMLMLKDPFAVIAILMQLPWFILIVLPKYK